MKTYLGILSTCLLALSLGCDRKAPVPKSSTDTPPASGNHVAKLVISYPGGLVPAQAWVETLQNFHAEHPNIQVVAKAIPDSPADEYRSYVEKFRGRSTEFDLFLGQIDWVGEFAKAGWLRDLENIVSMKERPEFFDGAMNSGSWEQRLHAVPYFVDGTVLYCQVAMLQKDGVGLPRTWADLTRTATEFKRRHPGEEIHGLLWPGQPAKEFVGSVMEFVWGNGGQLMNYTKIVVNSAQNRTTFGFIQGLIHRYGITPGSITNSSPEMNRQLFLEGKALFLRDWASNRGLLLTNAQVALIPLPAFPTHPPAASLDGRFLGINSRTRHVEASSQLLQHLISEPAMASLVKASGQLPARRRIYQDDEVLQAQPGLRGLEKALAPIRALPVVSDLGPLRDLLAAEFAALLAKAKSPEEVANALQSRIQIIVSPRNVAPPGGTASSSHLNPPSL